MGLDTTHGCWNGPYSSFNEWREVICRLAGLGKLYDYKGFGEGVKDFPKNDVIVELLNHSDCEGVILHKHCQPLAERMEQFVGKLDYADDYYSRKTRQFIDGLKAAHAAAENVVFH